MPHSILIFLCTIASFAEQIRSSLSTHSVVQGKKTSVDARRYQENTTDTFQFVTSLRKSALGGLFHKARKKGSNAVVLISFFLVFCYLPALREAMTAYEMYFRNKKNNDTDLP